VYEYISTAILLNKSETLLFIEPLYCSFCHC
jgi:hypothetical protein